MKKKNVNELALRWWFNHSLLGAVIVDGWAGWSPLEGPIARDVLDVRRIINSIQYVVGV